jgi:hypothetical protein
LTTEVIRVPWPASTHDLAVLRHPDRRTGWVSVIAATLSDPDPDLALRCDERLEQINERVPTVGARLQGATWLPGRPPQTIEVRDEPLSAPALLDRFDLSWEPPIRVIVGDDGRRLALAAHHAALDGRGMVALIHALVGGPVLGPATVEPADGGAGEPPWTALRRLLLPADRAAPSPAPPARDSLAVRTLPLGGRGVAARIAAAAIDAIGERNRRFGRPWRRIGLTIPIGGPPGIGNVASYRRVDLRPGDDVRAAVAQVLDSGAVPPEHTSAPRALRLLAPVADRFSDSLLVSNHTRYDMPELAQIEVYAVARGRSAIAFGTAGIAGGTSTLALRARDLDRRDTEALLDATVARLEGAA